jgi:hypothetical protein
MSSQRYRKLKGLYMMLTLQSAGNDGIETEALYKEYEEEYPEGTEPERHYIERTQGTLIGWKLEDYGVVHAIQKNRLDYLSQLVSQDATLLSRVFTLTVQVRSLVRRKPQKIYKLYNKPFEGDLMALAHFFNNSKSVKRLNQLGASGIENLYEEAVKKDGDWGKYLYRLCRDTWGDLTDEQKQKVKQAITSEEVHRCLEPRTLEDRLRFDGLEGTEFWDFILK